MEGEIAPPALRYMYVPYLANMYVPYLLRGKVAAEKETAPRHILYSGRAGRRRGDGSAIVTIRCLSGRKAHTYFYICTYLVHVIDHDRRHIRTALPTSTAKRKAQQETPVE